MPDRDPTGMYLYSVGGIGLCGEHIQELYTVYLTRFRTYKIALPPPGASDR